MSLCPWFIKGNGRVSIRTPLSLNEEAKVVEGGD